jgi:hypothetical protein
MDVPVVSGPAVRTGASDGPGMVWRPVQKSGAHECRLSKDTLIMNKVDFIAFIGKVINTSRVVESRNARSKVIVEKAKEILGVTDVTVEMVVDMLNNPKGGVIYNDGLPKGKGLQQGRGLG